MHLLRRALLLTAVLLGAVSVANGHANLFSYRTCTQHPTSSQRRHGAPTTDSTITFTVRSSGSTVSSLCAGQSYAVTVTFPQTREVVLTSTLGSLGGSSSCPNRLMYTSAAKSLSATLVVPCNTGGATSTQLFVTSATGEFGAFLQASLTLPVSSTCGNSCSSPPPSAVSGGTSSKSPPPPLKLSPPPPPPPPPPSVQEEADDDDDDDNDTDGSNLATGTGSTNSASGLKCQSSGFGYSCQMSVDSGVVLHWTTPSSSSPPDNACTRAATNSVAALVQQPRIHFALHSQRRGYVSLAFAATAGVMSPADAVIGVYNGGGVSVETYTLQGQDLGRDVSPSWAQNAAVTALSSSSGGGLLLCFSVGVDAAATTTASGRRRRGRSLQASAGNGAPTPDPSDLLLNWADSATSSLDGHDSRGSLHLNAVTGTASVVDTSTTILIVVHGALMIGAWVLLLPFGVLFARHRSLMGEWRFPCIKSKAAWFVMHMLCQLFGLVMFVGGFVLAIVKLDVESDSPVALAHKYGGAAVCGIAGCQLIVGFVRPAPDAPKRRFWNPVHHWLGRLAIALAWAMVALGIYLACDSYDQPPAAWALGAGGVVGALLVTEVLLWLVRQNQATAAEYSNTGPRGSANASSDGGSIKVLPTQDAASPIRA